MSRRGWSRRTRSGRTGSGRNRSQTERLLAATRRRLTAVTLLLLTLLVAGIGVTTAVAALRVLDADVDTALTNTVTATLHQLDGELPSATGAGDTGEGPGASESAAAPSASPATSESASAPSASPAAQSPSAVSTSTEAEAPGGSSSSEAEAPGSSASSDAETPQAPTTGPEAESPSVSSAPSETEVLPASSDTFLFYLDPQGTLLSGSTAVVVTGLPDQRALAAAIQNGSDIRTVSAGGFSVRLLTLPIVPSGGGSPVGYIQGGMRLTLHDTESTSLVMAIAVVGLIGLLAAAFLALVVTGRALIPIRRSFDAQRRFVADASHELRTPAALIRANAEVIQREDLVSEPGKALVQDIVAEADRLGRLVGDLLTIATTDTTGLALHRGQLDLVEVAADTARGTAALAGEREIRLVVDAAAPVLVNGDRDRLVQLLLVLLDNAIDHSPDGGTITIGVRSDGRSDRMAELTVDDEGPGIPPDMRERVFEPFTHLPGVRRHRAGGTGLGLAIARRIVTAHDGTIAVGDAPSGGARLIVRLPPAGGGSAA